VISEQVPLTNVTVLGSTGSIGKHTLDVLARHPDRFRVHALAANRSVDTLISQCQLCHPRYAVLHDAAAAEKLRSALTALGSATEVLSGEQAIIAMAEHEDCDTVVAGIVGSAGLLSTLAAARAGKRLLLANKESLVMSGQLLIDAASAHGAIVLPLDSEHNAIFQSLPSSEMGVTLAGVEKIMLTASGGPLRKCSLDELSVVTPQQALKHPNWSMGPKISIDSATLMNKGLEVIEACHLFGINAAQLDVVVHPESVIHSMVRYHDGSVIAQLGRPDMRTPIAHALAWPERIDSGVAPLDFTELSGLHFEAPDLGRFPALRLAYEALAAGGTAPTILNAANEVAVAAFLEARVAFLQLADVIEKTLAHVKNTPATDLPTIIEADRAARVFAEELVESY